MLFTFSAYSVAERITTLDEKLVHQRVGHPKHHAKDIEYLWHNFFDALKGLKDFLISHEKYSYFRKSFANWAIDFSSWNMHNYQDYFHNLIRQSLKNKFFDELDLSNTPKEDFYNEGLYNEMITILSERRPYDPDVVPKVSILIPTYNVEQYMRICLDSAVNQTLEEIEIIVINDGSTDNCLSIIKEYAAHDPHIKIIDKENGGYGMAMNRGFDIAKGKYLSFLDSDDFFEPKMLEEAFKKCERTGAEICVYQVRRYDNETGNTWFDKGSFVEANFPSESSGIEVFSAKDLGSHIFTTFMTWPWNKMFSRRFIMSNGLRYQEIMRTNDLYFVNTALLKANYITTVRSPLVNYRVGTKNNCQATNNKAPTDFHKALCALYGEVIKSMVDNALVSFYNLYVRSCNYNIGTLFNLDAEAYAYLYRYLHGEGFDIIDPTDIPAEFITKDNFAAYKECCQIRNCTFENYMVDKLSYYKKAVKILSDKIEKNDALRKDLDSLNTGLELTSKQLDEIKAAFKKIVSLIG